MKIKIINAIKVMMMISIILISISYLGTLFRPTDTDSSTKAIITFHSMEENSIEVIGYGSSRMWKGLDPLEMYENWGVGLYNYGCNWQKWNTTYLFFLDSLETQSPDVVIFEVRNINRLLDDTDMGGEIYYTRQLEDIDYKIEYLQQCFGTVLDRYISYIAPVFSFHENWKSISKNNFSFPTVSSNLTVRMGYSEFNTVTSITPVDSSTFEELEIDEDSIAILDSIVKICGENDIEIIFYVAPYSGEYNYSDAMAEYAKDNDCVYFDMFDYIDEIGISWETDFQDASHLNDDGADKISNFLGEYIVNNYEVTDFRTIEDNLWEQNSVE